PMARLSLRGNLHMLQVDGATSAAADALARHLGQTLPAAGAAVGGGDRPRVLWNGPGRWLIVAPDGDGLPARVAAVVGDGAAVVDLSHGRAVMRIRGAVWRQILAKGTAIDLDPVALTGEQVRLTALFHVPVVLDVRDDGAAVDIFAARSLAPDLWAALTDAAGEFGYRIV
ncbi:MAG: sarcosine oxidase subunit gamma, partial [Thalassobaculaceae bacterium]